MLQSPPLLPAAPRMRAHAAPPCQVAMKACPQHRHSRCPALPPQKELKHRPRLAWLQGSLQRCPLWLLWLPCCCCWPRTLHEAVWALVEQGAARSSHWRLAAAARSASCLLSSAAPPQPHLPHPVPCQLETGTRPGHPRALPKHTRQPGASCHWIHPLRGPQSSLPLPLHPQQRLRHPERGCRAPRA